MLEFEPLHHPFLAHNHSPKNPTKTATHHEQRNAQPISLIALRAWNATLPLADILHGLPLGFMFACAAPKPHKMLAAFHPAAIATASVDDVHQLARLLPWLWWLWLDLKQPAHGVTFG
jgi:hypothetical protein